MTFQLRGDVDSIRLGLISLLLDLFELEKFETYVAVKLFDMLLQGIQLIMNHALLCLSTLDLVLEVVCASF